jgi:hypothetical protein
MINFRETVRSCEDMADEPTYDSKSNKLGITRPSALPEFIRCRAASEIKAPTVHYVDSCVIRVAGA